VRRLTEDARKCRRAQKAFDEARERMTAAIVDARRAGASDRGRPLGARKARSEAEEAPDEPARLHSQLFTGTRSGGLGLLRDLHDLYLMATECDISWTVVGQAAQGARDTELLEVVQRCAGETAIQLQWLRTRMKQAAPQALVVAT
jgi:hypothetical protein